MNALFRRLFLFLFFHFFGECICVQILRQMAINYSFLLPPHQHKEKTFVILLCHSHELLIFNFSLSLAEKLWEILFFLFTFLYLFRPKCFLLFISSFWCWEWMKNLHFPLNIVVVFLSRFSFGISEMFTGTVCSANNSISEAFSLVMKRPLNLTFL